MVGRVAYVALALFAGCTQTSSAPPIDQLIELTLVDRPLDPGPLSFVVVYQDGDSAWKRAPDPVGDTYSFVVHSSRYGVGWACRFGTGPYEVGRVTFGLFTTEERTALTATLPSHCTDPPSEPAEATLSGAVSNRGSLPLMVAFGDAFANVDLSTGAYTLQTPPATRDLVVLESSGSFDGSLHPPNRYATRVAIIRDVALLGPMTTVDVDFNAAQQTRTFALPTNGTSTLSRLRTHGGTVAHLFLGGGIPPSPLVELSSAQQSVGDSYDLRAQFVEFAQTTQWSWSIDSSTTAPPPTTSVPPTLGPVTAALIPSPSNPTVETSWKAYAGASCYEARAFLPASASCSTCWIGWDAFISPGYAGPTPAFRIPDLSAFGWPTEIDLASGVSGMVTARIVLTGSPEFPPREPVAPETAFVGVNSDWVVAR